MRLLQPLILEGPNKSGKSTLRRRLTDLFGFPFFHTGGPKRDAVELGAAVIAACNAEPSIIDRHPCISQPVYDRALGRPQWFTELELGGSLAELTPCPIVLYCRPPFDMLCKLELKQSPNRINDHDVEIEQNYVKIVHEYDRTIARYTARNWIRTIHYNWVEHDHWKWFEGLAATLKESACVE